MNAYKPGNTFTYTPSQKFSPGIPRRHTLADAQRNHYHAKYVDWLIKTHCPLHIKSNLCAEKFLQGLTP